MNSVNPDQTAKEQSDLGLHCFLIPTVKVLKFWTPKIFAVITLKVEQDGFTKE